MPQSKNFLRLYWIPLTALVGITLYFILWSSTLPQTVATIPLLIVIFAGGLPLLWNTLVALTKRHFNVDVIAILSIFGGFAVGQYLAAAVIVLMMSGGEALEAYALERATSALQSLMKQRPRIANRWDGHEFREIAVNDVAIGDKLLIRPGESVPVDGEIIDGASDVNESLLTGESLPVTRKRGETVLSGSINITGPLTITATTGSEQSTFTKIMELVEQAHNNKSDIQYIADRFGAWFTPMTLIFVIVTWLTTHDPIRAYAVLVIATPCPLILATPIAIIAGIGRAAKQGIIIKSGASLEAMARARTILFDKTGTLTTGNLVLQKITHHSPKTSEDDVLALASALEHYSNHVVARSVVLSAKQKNLKIPDATDVKEIPARGLQGLIKKKTIFVGNRSFMHDNNIILPHTLPDPTPGEIQLFVAEQHVLLAVFHFRDQVRPESKQIIHKIKQLGFTTIAMVTGDRTPIAQQIAHGLDIQTVYAEVSPQGKLDTVEALVQHEHHKHRTVIMVGDGINDAPALERADVGIAIGRQGTEVSVAAADVVLLGETIRRLPQSIMLGKSVLAIASQGIWFGMICSFLGMFAASFGYLPPVTGAILQEVIDVMVILNALRVLAITL